MVWKKRTNNKWEKKAILFPILKKADRTFDDNYWGNGQSGKIFASYPPKRLKTAWYGDWPNIWKLEHNFKYRQFAPLVLLIWPSIRRSIRILEWHPGSDKMDWFQKTETHKAFIIRVYRYKFIWELIYPFEMRTLMLHS